MPERDEEIQQRIREHAYRLWQEEGCPGGRAGEHWRRAEALEAERLREDERIDEEGRESFPASDPPSHNSFTGEWRPA
ncbi:DUF2934 domain-containing protein [Roseomonas marmotae]|uniref:DUF2934 domain-containing protein n=1 Tax=Roseomonas marmotae TaxID=2768161 RepID=A0ABS3KCN6_9PROT|nr:DUF2934 domain-containing protein [Roseomonas marmotae]MBO1075232.1 DUF2934 domain-containing protein [Roseomonas marmotae]QTI79662.1 DUF2934 domain-containing protein [Roseomonas marmotae]